MSSIDKANKEIQAILKKHNLKISQNIAFPIYRELPDEVKLALLVLGKHKMKIRFVLTPIKE